MFTRRQILGATSLAGLGALVGPGGARAFQVTEPTQRIETLYSLRAACRSDEGAYHAQLIQDLQAALEGAELSDDEKAATVASLVCPSCGCRVNNG
ncbi:MAG: hypothetical protein U1E97_12180 [Alphaproteobacteria bacterium]